MKHKRTLLFQIGIVVFAVLTLILIIAQRYVFTQGTEIYLSAKTEMVDKDLFYLSRDLAKYVNRSVIQYWCEHPQESKKQMSDREIELITQTDFISDELQDIDLESYDDELKLAICKDVYMTLEWELQFTSESRGYLDVYCLYPLENNKAFVMADMIESIYMNSEFLKAYADNPLVSMDSIKPLNYKYTFGSIVDLDYNDFEGLKELIENKEEGAVCTKRIDTTLDTAFYTGCRPIYDEEGELLYILCVEYDWSDVYSDLLERFSVSLIKHLLVGFLIALGLVVFSLFCIVVKPLKKVKESLDIYMVTKKSDDVDKKLAGLKTRNEIGILAQNVRNLAKEIDKYTDENIALASQGAKVKTELDMAAAIQRQALIKSFPKSSRYEVIASMTPAKQVGGDFYDIFDIDKDHVGFVIADVSGKGMPAALLMMAAMTSLRHSASAGRKPSEILSKVNNDLVDRNIMDMFVTVWLGILDKRTGILMTGNAGHENPVICRDGKFEIIRERHGLVVGAMEEYKYRDYEIQLQAGDSIFVYTDGVLEATDSDLKMFGEERMLEALNSEPDASPERMLRNVKRAVDLFVGAAEQFDDLTMMYIVYKGIGDENN